MLLVRLIAILIVVILGSVAAEDLTRVLAPLTPILVVIVVAVALGGGWFRRRRRF